jgi:hypothetical protein
MTGGVHPSATAGQWTRLGRTGPESRGGLRCRGRGYWAAGAGGPKRRERSKGEKERVFYFIKTHKQLNSNKNLNSNTPKIMHQHVCNSNLLYFII